MADFVAGVLIESKDGATHQGQIWDRWLKLQHPSGQVLSIFDLSAISSGLTIAKRYELVLLATVLSSFTYCSEPGHDPETEVKTWQAVVIDANWQPPDEPLDCYQQHSPHLLRPQAKFVLAETELGDLLLSSSHIEQDVNEALQVGMCLEWEHVRFDLYAVI